MYFTQLFNITSTRLLPNRVHFLLVQFVLRQVHTHILSTVTTALFHLSVTLAHPFCPQTSPVFTSVCDSPSLTRVICMMMHFELSVRAQWAQLHVDSSPKTINSVQKVRLQESLPLPGWYCVGPVQETMYFLKECGGHYLMSTFFFLEHL